MKNIKVPHTFTIIFFVVFFCAILTYVIPMGNMMYRRLHMSRTARKRRKQFWMPTHSVW